MFARTQALKALAAAAGLAGLMAPTASHAVVAVGQSFDFYGTCSDCTLNSAPGAPIATLILDNGYVLGSTITPENIVSFSYVGSNLVFAYEVSGRAGLADPDAFADIYAAGGSMTAGPGAKNVVVEFIDGLRFESASDGSWFTCGRGPAGFYSGTCTHLRNNDVGVGTWLAPVPEPATWGLMALGMAGLALRRRLG